jgi:hypothetical protein
MTRLKGCPGGVRTALHFGSQSTLGGMVLLTADG